ncbi:hypothetical protein D3C71_1514850 [compost metagenome]
MRLRSSGMVQRVGNAFDDIDKVAPGPGLDRTVGASYGCGNNERIMLQAHDIWENKGRPEGHHSDTGMGVTTEHASALYSGVSA